MADNFLEPDEDAAIPIVNPDEKDLINIQQMPIFKKKNSVLKFPSGRKYLRKIVDLKLVEFGSFRDSTQILKF